MRVLDWHVMIAVNGSMGVGFRMAFDDNGVGEDGSKWLEGCGF